LQRLDPLTTARAFLMARNEIPLRVDSPQSSELMQLGSVDEPSARYLPAYRHLSLRKSITVLRDGSAVVQNQAGVEILNAEEFTGIPHFFDLRPMRDMPLPTLQEMLDNGSAESDGYGLYERAFFVSRLIEWNSIQPDVGWRTTIEEVSSLGTERNFTIGFTKPVKSGDRISYEYVWGMPHLFDISADDLRKGDSPYVWLSTTHGPLVRAELILRFQTGHKLKLEPYCQLSPYPKDLVPGDIKGKPIEPTIQEDFWYRTYSWVFASFWGTAIARWVPGGG
jgi:hypothetical protein